VVDDGVVFLLGFFLAGGSSFNDSRAGPVAAVREGPVPHLCVGLGDAVFKY
jgi:hypothetical protein